ncbi:hypothetical protein [Vibrio parahaemolyticus]|uniref:hypothetical protein n=1 Tax=Vibrio parahaemolyticus TaxID=670 RepID=UPI00215CD613|nr:hypothetical protein [Vibrio parahaemolyticus]MCR9833745.1 hypothetical protein [Vibrio parahaemolyticus]
MIEKPDYSMYFKIGKGLAIYRQKHSQSYYVRLRIDKKNVQRSLKTTNRDEALRKAIRFEDEIDGEIHHFITIEKGKTKGYSRSRKIPLSKSAVNSLVEMAKIQNPSENITEKNFVFVRKPILESSYDTKGDFVKMFKTLIDSLIADKKVSQPYTLYSCRHYFITKRLSIKIRG